MKKFYLVDVSSLFFRAFYAVRPLQSEKGLPTNAIYGFLSMTVKLLKDMKPDYLAFCYDRPEKSFRIDIDPNYKANRGEMPEDLGVQIPYIKKITEYLGIPTFEKKKFEADDVIGTLVKWAEEQNLFCTIISGDKDFGQLINENVVMFDSMRNKTYDIKAVEEKWGVSPSQFIDFLSIVGDSSDNIPGVKGVGPKGAQKLLKEYKDLNEIYDNLDSITPPGVHKKLVQSKEAAFLAKKLVTICKDVELDISLEGLVPKPLKRDELRELLKELSFHGFIAKILGETDESITGQFESRKQIGVQKKVDNSVAETKNTEINNEAISEEIELNIQEYLLSKKKLLNKLDFSQPIWGWVQANVVFIGQNKSVFEINDPESNVEFPLDIRWKGYNLKAFWDHFKIFDGEAHEDLQIASYLLDPGKNLDLIELYAKYVGKPLPEFPRPARLFSVVLELSEELNRLLLSKSLTGVYQEMELPLVSVLRQMEVVGIKVDSDILNKLSVQFGKKIESIEKSIKLETGLEFNLASPKQLGEVLFEKLKLPKGKKTKTGYSTSADVLSKLADDYPIVEQVLKFREYSKLKSTYTDSLAKLVNEKTGRVHTSFVQTKTSTGRLSSVNPNLQNIPIRTETGRLIRTAFVAKKDNLLVSADYSQIELRVLAHISKDASLIRAFSKDLDVHTSTASEIFNIELSDVDNEMRRKAKAVNFGIAYGQGVYGLAESLKIPRKEAKLIIEEYFKKFSGVQTYMAEVVEKAKEDGYVSTLFGRPRYLPELSSSNGMIKKFGERAAINAPIQGTASDLVKMAMIELKKCKIPILLQVHDELVFEIEKGSVKETMIKIQDIMENIAQLDVPLKINMAKGINWNDAHA